MIAEFSLVLLVVVAVNWLATPGSGPWRHRAPQLLLLANVPLLAYGLLLRLLPAAQLAALLGPAADPAGETVLALSNLGQSLAIMSLCGGLVLLNPVRRQLAARLPLAADHPVHSLALMFAAYVVGLSLSNLLVGGLEALAELAPRASIMDVLGQQAFFLLLALLGAGWLVRRSTVEVGTRLDLTGLTAVRLRAAGRWLIGLVVLQWAVGAIWIALAPDQVALLENVTGSLLADIDTPVEWLVLALATGIGEELLFRGALLPRFGNGVTAFLFAGAHTQYAVTPATLLVFVLGWILGRIRLRHGTTTTVLVHAGYNLTLGLLSLLAGQLAS